VNEVARATVVTLMVVMLIPTMWAIPPLITLQNTSNPKTETQTTRNCAPLYAPSPEVTLEWNYTTGAAVYSSPAVADVDGDGQLEIVVGSSDWYAYCLNRTGGKEWSYKTGDDVTSSPAIADVNGDGKLEVLIGSDDFEVYCLNGTTGAKLWNYTTGDFVRSSPSVCDVNEDGYLEVIVGSYDNNIYCLNGMTGAKLWNFTTGATVYSSPAVADVDGDGDQEVLVGSLDNKTYCLNYAGGMEWSYTTGFWVFSSPFVGDVDRDGDQEVLVGSLDNKTYCLNYAGGMEWAYTTGGIVQSCPAVVDVDGDARLEVLVGSYDKNVTCLSVVGAPFNAGAYPWPSIGFRGDVRHSGCYADSDTDGLTDSYEVTAETNPHQTDTDTDGVTDYGEFMVSTDPLFDPVPPAATTDLAAGWATDNSITLRWTAQGDNGATGNATGYIVRYSTTGPITEENWDSADNYTQSWTPLSAGSTESHAVSGLIPGTKYWFAVKAYDETPNLADISNSPTATTRNTAMEIIITIAAISGIVAAVVAVVLYRRKK